MTSRLLGGWRRFPVTTAARLEFNSRDIFAVMDLISQRKLRGQREKDVRRYGSYRIVSVQRRLERRESTIRTAMGREWRVQSHAVRHTYHRAIPLRYAYPRSGGSPPSPFPIVPVQLSSCIRPTWQPSN